MPERPGLGLEIDENFVEKNRVDYTWVDTPRHVYRYARANGEVTYYGCSKQALHNVYPRDAMPVSEAGSECVPVEDDGSKSFAAIYDAVQDGNTLRRVEKSRSRKQK